MVTDTYYRYKMYSCIGITTTMGPKTTVESPFTPADYTVSTYSNYQ